MSFTHVNQQVMHIMYNIMWLQTSKLCACILYAKQKQPGCKKVRGQSEATMVISDQKL